MRYQDRSLENYDCFRSEPQMILAAAGFPGVLEILADIAQEYGDGEIARRSEKAGIPVDHPFFLNASAQIDQVREQPEELI